MTEHNVVIEQLSNLEDGWHWTKGWAKWQQLSGARPSIAGARQIARGPSDCWGPLRLLGPQVAGAPQIDAAPQIVGDPSDCWGPLRLLGAPRVARGTSDCWRLLRLMGPLRFSGTLQIAEGPSDCWGPLDGWGPLCIAQPAQPIATPLLLSLTSGWGLQNGWIKLADFHIGCVFDCNPIRASSVHVISARFTWYLLGRFSISIKQQVITERSQLLLNKQIYERNNLTSELQVNCWIYHTIFSSKLTGKLTHYACTVSVISSKLTGKLTLYPYLWFPVNSLILKHYTRAVAYLGFQKGGGQMFTGH